MTLVSAPFLTVSPWMTPEVLVAGLGVLAALAGGAGFWEWIKSRRKEPISAEEHEEAIAEEEAAAADQLVQTALDIVKNGESRIAAMVARHEEEMVSMRRELSSERECRRRVEDDVEQLKKDSREQSHKIFVLRAGLTRIQEWWDDIVSRWEHIRLLDEPPSFPQIRID